MASKLLQVTKAVIDAIVFSNTWISLGALSLYASIVYVAEFPFVWYEGLLIFTATFIGYNILKLKGLQFEGNQSPFSIWMRHNKKYLYGLIAVSLLLLLYSLLQLTQSQFYILLITAFISLVYIGFEKFNLRSFWFLKTQLVALVWAVFIVGIPLADHLFLLDIDAGQILLLTFIFAAVFFFILGLTIPFDIRDWEVDMLDVNVKTMPMIFGLKGTKFLAVGHLILSQILFALVHNIAIMLLPIYIAAYFTIYRLRKGSSEYNYTLVLDGLIILCFPMIWISSHFFN